MIIANIVSKTNINGISKEFNVVNSLDLADKNLPTLIVGYDYVNKLFPDFDITNMKLSNNLYWTFKRTEKRDKFEEDLRWFIKEAYQKFTGEVKYVFVDPIQYSSRALFKIIRKIFSLENKISYRSNNMIFIYGEKLIFGVDLNLLEYMSLDVDKIKRKIKENTTELLPENPILIEYKKNAESLGYQDKHLPFLYSIFNG